jgi:hypothetical protein
LVAQDLEKTSKDIPVDANIGIHERENVTSGRCGSPVARDRRPTRTIEQPDHTVGISGGELGRTIAARIINDDELPLTPGYVTVVQRRERGG